MKKLKKILILLFGLCPIIISAQTKEETKWRWYTLKENNVHYESEVENICGYLESYDKNDFIYSNWNYSYKKPEEKDYREIEEVTEILEFDRRMISIIKITKIINDNRLFKLHELEIIDEKNNHVPMEVSSVYVETEDIEKVLDNNYDTWTYLYSFSDFKMVMPKLYNIENLTLKIIYSYDESFLGLEFASYINEQLETNSFANYSTDIENSCDGELCTMKIKVIDSKMSLEDILLETHMYKYRDKLYKCFTKEKSYVPGYYEELDGFIKDEENFIINKIETKTEEVNVNNEEFKIPVNSKLNLEDNKVENNKQEEQNKDKLAIISKENAKTDNDEILIYEILLISLVLLTISITIAKYVKKRRTN